MSKSLLGGAPAFVKQSAICSLEEIHFNVASLLSTVCWIAARTTLSLLSDTNVVEYTLYKGSPQKIV